MKKAAARLRISRSCRSTRFSRSCSRGRCRSSLVSTSTRSPRSASSCRVQFRSDCGEQPSSPASSGIERSPLRSKRTAFRRNSGGYGGFVLGIIRSRPLAHAASIRCHPKRGNSTSARRGICVWSGWSGLAPPPSAAAAPRRLTYAHPAQACSASVLHGTGVTTAFHRRCRGAPPFGVRTRSHRDRSPWPPVRVCRRR